MNAGVKEHEIFNRLHSVQIDGAWIPKKQIPHGYRFADLNGIATAGRFYLTEGFDSSLLQSLAKLRANQPSDPSAGSAFKNPLGDAAGRLIDVVGLKSYQRGGMAWSDRHANFLVNKGSGTYAEAIHLLTLAKEKVYGAFGITLEEEIKILDTRHQPSTISHRPTPQPQS